MRRTTLALLIFAILTATAGCSLLRSSHKPDSPQAPQVVRGRIIPACRTQSGRQDRPQKLRVKITPHMYTYEVAWSATTDQFVLTDVSPKVKPLERAHRVRLAVALPESAHAKVTRAKEIIHFSFGSAAISPSERMRLGRVAERIKRHHGQRVSVAGYTCWIGPKEVNDRLALARAMAVVHELGKQGVKVKSVRSSGKCCYIDLKHAAPNRRAEILWEERR